MTKSDFWNSFHLGQHRALPGKCTELEEDIKWVLYMCSWIYSRWLTWIISVFLLLYVDLVYARITWAALSVHITILHPHSLPWPKVMNMYRIGWMVEWFPWRQSFKNIHVQLARKVSVSNFGLIVRLSSMYHLDLIVLLYILTHSLFS